MIVAVAINANGPREIIGIGVGPREAAVFWIAFLRGLVRRGLRAVKVGQAQPRLRLPAA